MISISIEKGQEVTEDIAVDQAQWRLHSYSVYLRKRIVYVKKKTYIKKYGGKIVSATASCGKTGATKLCDIES